MNSPRRIVVKIGTSVLLDGSKRISPSLAESIARQIRAVRDMGVEVIVVSSGAIACGMEAIALTKKPKDMAKKQALASIGQIVLMKLWMGAFARHGLTVSQVLLTHEDIKSRVRCLNLMNTIDTLLAMGAVPVINENDTLSFQEIRFGDNDNLSALIAQITNADLLFLLSDVEGLFERDPKRYPRARMISTVKKIDEAVERLEYGQEDRRGSREAGGRHEERKEYRRHGEQVRGREEGGPVWDTDPRREGRH